MNYPGGVSAKTHKVTSYGNRGMALEDDINTTNDFYLSHDIAGIHKKPTPIQPVKVDFNGRHDVVIREAYYKIPSTTDYNGIFKGKYIDFEAKETNLKSFPLSNIHKHQIKHLESIYHFGGIGFIIVRFNKENEDYLLFIENLLSFLENNNRKSIPLDYFKKIGHKIELKYHPRLDYLKIVDLYIKEGVSRDEEYSKEH